MDRWFLFRMLALAYEYTKDEKYLKVLNRHVQSFYIRIAKNIEVDHHDLGFLYYHLVLSHIC